MLKSNILRHDFFDKIYCKNNPKKSKNILWKLYTENYIWVLKKFKSKISPYL